MTKHLLPGVIFNQVKKLPMIMQQQKLKVTLGQTGNVTVAHLTVEKSLNQMIASTPKSKEYTPDIFLVGL